MEEAGILFVKTKDGTTVAMASNKNKIERLVAVLAKHKLSFGKIHPGKAVYESDSYSDFVTVYKITILTDDDFSENFLEELRKEVSLATTTSPLNS